MRHGQRHVPQTACRADAGLGHIAGVAAAAAALPDPKERSNVVNRDEAEKYIFGRCVAFFLEAKKEVEDAVDLQRYWKASWAMLKNCVAAAFSGGQ